MQGAWTLDRQHSGSGTPAKRPALHQLDEESPASIRNGFAQKIEPNSILDRGPGKENEPRREPGTLI